VSRWGADDLPRRLAWLRAFRRLIAKSHDELCELVGAEVHKPRVEALMADVLPLELACVWLERNAAKLLATRTAPGKPWLLLGQRAQLRRAPLGTVGIIATWNYPIGLLGIQLIQALVAGNRVVIKPSERAPRSQARLIELARGAADEAGVARAEFDVVLRSLPATREAGTTLLHTERLDHLVFTGSTSVGRQIAAWGAETLTPTTLELSGRDSALVLADANLKVAARAIWNAVSMNGGQTCMAPRRALVAAEIYPAFCSALAYCAAAGPARRLIDAPAAARVAGLAQQAFDLGGRSLSGVLERACGEGDGAGSSIRPQAIADCQPDWPIVDGDHFGPLLAVVRCKSVDEMLAVHHRCDQHLATSVYTRNVRAAQALVARLGAAQVTINDTVLPTAHPGTSIARLGESGWGTSRGAAGILA